MAHPTQAQLIEKAGVTPDLFMLRVTGAWLERQRKEYQSRAGLTASNRLEPNA